MFEESSNYLTPFFKRDVGDDDNDDGVDDAVMMATMIRMELVIITTIKSVVVMTIMNALAGSQIRSRPDARDDHKIRSDDQEMLIGRPA